MKETFFATFVFFVIFFSETLTAEDTMFRSARFSGSGNCSLCHDNLTDSTGDDVSIVRDWGASMMANSAKDPFWKAKLASELSRNQHLAPVINDKCTQCHAPMANYEITEVQGKDIEVLGAQGILNKQHELHDVALNGVSCTLCHQIANDTALGSEEGFSGHYKINDKRLIYGQYADVFTPPMQNNVGYTPVFSAHISGSEVCATCHELSTPYVDAEGNILTTTPDTEFPEQTPYTEWQHSNFSDTGSTPQTCQQCHMPQTRSIVSNRPNWLLAKNGFAKHHLVGANTFMLTMLRDNAAALDVNPGGLDLSISRAREMLKSSVSMEIVSAKIEESMLDAVIKLKNNSGHKTPTSYPSRRMWLHFKVTDSLGKIVFESGRINQDGSIAGVDNDVDQSIFEPHYQLITKQEQVQVYEAIMGNTDDEVTYTLLRAAKYLKDNRLTPSGFDKTNVPSKIGVYGKAIDDAGFNDGVDEIRYRFPVTSTDPLTITVALNYQTVLFGFIQDLFSQSSLPEVETFKQMYDAQSLKHEEIGSIQIIVEGLDKQQIPIPIVSLIMMVLSIIGVYLAQTRR